MGRRTIEFCDKCGKEFEAPGKNGEKLILKLEGMKYTDAAGSTDGNVFHLEMHKKCWEAFIRHNLVDCDLLYIRKKNQC